MKQMAQIAQEMESAEQEQMEEDCHVETNFR
jgi:hypothetical protein